MSTVEFIGVAVIGYLSGSISFAVVIAKRKGVDIFKVGSGNPGATNVKRALGKGAGNLCFALDALKGLVAAGWPRLALPGDPEAALHLAIVGLAAAIIGHSFSVFLKFRGGKGVAVTMGGLLAIMPVSLLIGAAAWLVGFYATRIVSVGSLLFGLSLPVSALWLPGVEPRLWFGLVLAALICLRHKSNIQRLLKGEEGSFKKKG